MKRPFVRRLLCIALGPDADSSRKFPRAENATRRKSWGRSVCRTAILCGGIKRNTSTRKRIFPLSTATCCRIFTAVATGCISSRTTLLITRSRKCWGSLPNTTARSKCFRCRPILLISTRRSGSGITPGSKAPTTATSTAQRRYASRCSRRSPTCKNIPKKSKAC